MIIKIYNCSWNIYKKNYNKNLLELLYGQKAYNKSIGFVYNLTIKYLCTEVFIMVRFTLPRDLYHGKGSLEALKTLEGKKAIICVGGGSMKRNGFLQKAEDYLKGSRNGS